MKRRDCELYIELAELVRANLNGPMKRKMTIRSQQRLVKRLQQSGVLSIQEAQDLRIQK